MVNTSQCVSVLFISATVSFSFLVFSLKDDDFFAHISARSVVEGRAKLSWNFKKKEGPTDYFLNVNTAKGACKKKFLSFAISPFDLFFLP